ncbi:MAG: peptide chain release factor N(5)-glutamine methyltransferase [Deferribacteres bacterium]|nr:peptide chain release factor N(5)-glutamine methyltransferase [candidate division KSB1 bacterium]MCB9503999.1 peptide chain release factor N(5)-glutamine methyltransferase [Deferribacteres bacterium]
MPGSSDQWTVIKLIDWSTNYLKEKGVENARLSVEHILSAVLDFNRVQLYLHFDRPLTQEELALYKPLLLRRANREPLQYILGFTEFYSLKIFVREGVLIPRPETELLVEKTLELAKKYQGSVRILDIGTGSGNIPIALIKNNPQLKVSAVDISPEALLVARENAKHHEVLEKIEFLQADIDDNSVIDQFESQFDIIVSNPPYIANSEKSSLQPEIVDFEPEIALFCEDALKFYKRISYLTNELLASNGSLLCEIGAEQGRAVKSIFEEHSIRDVEIIKDLSGRDRFVYGRIDSSVEEQRNRRLL